MVQAESLEPATPSFEKDLASVQRREAHLWVVALALLVLLVAVNVGTSYVLGASNDSWSIGTNSVRGLVGVALLTVVFCGYVVYARSSFAQIRRLFEVQAMRDPLTGLLNRKPFAARAAQEIARAERAGTVLAVMLCDLDDFKGINDSHGHSEGDRVLQQVARTLLHVTRGADLVFRWGGDEMLVLLAPTARDGVMVVADRARRGVREIAEGRTYATDLSIGIALYPEHALDVSELINLADRALYIAKRSGAKVHVGEEELRLDPQAIAFVYQPVVDSRTRAVVGHEVLSRDPSGRLSIVDLFRRYEAVGQLGELKAMIFAAQLKNAEELELERVFINVDFSLLANLTPPPRPERTEVVLEISEAETMTDIERYLEVVTAWRERGFKFAIDDFGSSFLSLPFVAQLFPSFIKMDRSALVEATGSERFAGFLRDMVAAVRNYSSEGIIAEGIETEEELTVVRQLGVDQVQGYLTGRPVSLERPGVGTVADGTGADADGTGAMASGAVERVVEVPGVAASSASLLAGRGGE